MYRLTWMLVDNCVDHQSETCRCEASVCFPRYPSLGSIQTPRMRGTRALSYGDYMMSFLIEILRRYELVSDRIVPRAVRLGDGVEVLRAGFKAYSTPTNTVIRSPFMRSRVPSAPIVVQNIHLEAIVKELDVKYMNYLGVRPDTLASLAFKRLSFYETMFGSFNGYRYVVNTSSNLSTDKIIKLFAEFSKPGISRESEYRMRGLLNRGLRKLEELLNVNAYRGKTVFVYHPSMLKSFVSSTMSSAGIRAGQDSSSMVGNVKCKRTVLGKKFDQFQYYAPRFHEAMVNLFNYGLAGEREKNLFESYCHISMKNEFKFVWPLDGAQAEKLIDKCREFFIPNMMQQFLSKLLMTPRQKYERGDYIRIGQKWTYGGAQDFAVFLLAGHPDIVWHTGDFTKLDKTLKDFLLGYYVASGMGYFTVHQSQEKFFQDLFAILIEHVCVKIVNHVGGVWTIMRAFMYSGGFETSHGDSWCVFLIWLMFVLHIADTHLDLAEELIYAIGKTLRITIYGDDHVWTTPKKYAGFMNEHKFAEFVKEFLQMEIRDALVLDNFFSTVNEAGEIQRAGVVFLKRYFIFDDSRSKKYPVIYPFKPTHQTMIKLFCSRDSLDVTYVLQSIGQAYDTLGTNPVSYSMCYDFYCYYMRKVNQPIYKVIAEAIAKSDHVSVSRLMKKSGITLNELSQGFPTLKYLIKRHRIDPTKNSNKIPLMTTSQLYQINEEEEFGY